MMARRRVYALISLLWERGGREGGIVLNGGRWVTWVGCGGGGVDLLVCQLFASLVRMLSSTFVSRTISCPHM